MVPHRTASPGRYQCLAQAIQPDQTSSRIEHARTRTRNLIRETKNQWANLGGWTTYRGKEAVEEHRKVFEVALARDIDTAAEMLKTHIDKGLEHTLAAF